MRLFIAALVLIFTLQSWAKADGINEFQIEGISIGDSLLDHFSNSEIMNSKHFYYPSSKKFFQINFFRVSDFKTYEHLTALVKANDKNYIIYELSGYIDYKKSISKCYNKSKILISDKYPFDLIKFKDENFNFDKNFKCGDAIIKINKPSWLYKNSL